MITTNKITNAFGYPISKECLDFFLDIVSNPHRDTLDRSEITVDYLKDLKKYKLLRAKPAMLNGDEARIYIQLTTHGIHLICKNQINIDWLADTNFGFIY